MTHAQEKPDLDEQPESAPDGIELLEEAIRKLLAEMVFSTKGLPHALQVMSLTPSHELTRASKRVLHCWQRNS